MTKRVRRMWKPCRKLFSTLWNHAAHWAIGKRLVSNSDSDRHMASDSARKNLRRTLGQIDDDWVRQLRNADRLFKKLMTQSISPMTFGCPVSWGWSFTLSTMQYLMLLMGKYPAPLRMPQNTFERFWALREYGQNIAAQCKTGPGKKDWECCVEQCAVRQLSQGLHGKLVKVGKFYRS